MGQRPSGKEDIRPVARRGDRWTIGGMPEPRPLYCLPDLAGADRVYITEGEKAADAARAIGLTATTSAHGSQSPDKTDWSPLAGKECVILPDNDDPGGKYADAVAAILAKLTPAPVVKVVELPDLPDHGDIADWVEARADADAGELRRQVEALADEAEAIQPDRPAARIERFQPFPTDALPEPIRGFVVAGAKAIGCDSSYLALPMLTALAAAIGNTRRIQLKRGWSAPAIIWTAIVGESGTSKTPAFKLVMRPMRDRQRKALEAHAEAMKQYEADLAHYDKALSAWKRDKKTEEPPPTKPDPPNAERYRRERYDGGSPGPFAAGESPRACCWPAMNWPAGLVHSIGTPAARAVPMRRIGCRCTTAKASWSIERPATRAQSTFPKHRCR